MANDGQARLESLFLHRIVKADNIVYPIDPVFAITRCSPGTDHSVVEVARPRDSPDRRAHERHPSRCPDDPGVLLDLE
ncbi:hypothetical protein [Nocardiopsis alba]|uniref:hypothetical protein n=1 Tax=Nocardiopsis alba TaxID=53437 RepID=UPI0035DFD751